MATKAKTQRIFYIVGNGECYGSGETPQQAADDFQATVGNAVDSDCDWFKATQIKVEYKEVSSQVLVEREDD